MATGDGAPWRLDAKTAIVTGASSGLGAGIAAVLAEAGARLVLVGRDRTRLRDVATDIRSSGGEAEQVIADITAGKTHEEIIATAVSRFGSVDILVHSAGVFTAKPFLETDPDEFMRMLLVHAVAPFALTKAAVPHMPSGSAITFVGSNLAHHSLAGTAAYSASKAAEERLATTIAAELAPRGIRVNSVSPGLTKTPMTEAVHRDPQAAAEAAGLVPLGRLGEVPDVAGAVAFLSSDAASYVHGTTLIIDGGVVSR